MTKLIVLQGPSGSGKSTFTKRLFPLGTRVIISADARLYIGDKYVWSDARAGEAHKACLRDFLKLIMEPVPPEVVVIDMTNIRHWMMTPYIFPAKAFGWDVEIHTFMVDPKVAAARNSERCPEFQIQRQVVDMEFPMPGWGRWEVHFPDGGGWVREAKGEKPDG